MNKKEIRENISEKLKKLDTSEKHRKDEIIYSKVIRNSLYQKCKSLFIFVSYKNEVNTHNIIKHAIDNGKTVAVPVILSLDEGMIAVRINGMEQLKENKYGILEPVLNNENILVPESIDLVIVPGAAFDKNGGRVGYGAGMYDKFLKSINPKAKKVAIAYEFQVLDYVPMEPHDIYVDEVIKD